MKKVFHDNIELGKRLRQARLQKRLTIEEVSAAIGVASSTYREWENGRAITGNPYPKLSSILGLSVYTILGIEDKTNEALFTFVSELEKCIQHIKTYTC